MLKNHDKTVKNSVGILEILATQETAPVVTTVETTHTEIIVVTAVTGESKAPHSTITIGLAQNVKIRTLLSAKCATDVKHPGLVAAGVLETTAVVQTDDHNETVDATSNVAATTGKKSTTITIGHAENATTPISPSDKSATDVKHLALVAVEADQVVAEMAAVDTAEETVVETDAAAAEAEMAAVDTAEETEAETVVETDAAAAEAEMAAVGTAAETVVETDAAAAEAEMAAVGTAAEIVVETDAAAAEAEMAAVDTAAETVVETVAETDAAAAETVVITIVVLKATTQIIVMQRASAQDTLTIGDQTPSNRGSPTDTTIDWRSTT